MFNLATPLDTVFSVLEILGLIAFAISGVLAAARCHLDWLGGIVLAVIVAVGGGTTRDILLGEPAVNWIDDPSGILIGAAAAVVVMIIMHVRASQIVSHSLAVNAADAVGMAAFVVVGAGISMDHGISGWLAVLLGVITGTAGGVIRDVMTQHRPLLISGEFYAISAIAGAGIYVLMVTYGVLPELAMWLPIAVVLGIRLLSIKYNWCLPLLHNPERGGPEAKSVTAKH